MGISLFDSILLDHDCAIERGRVSDDDDIEVFIVPTPVSEHVKRNGAYGNANNEQRPHTCVSSKWRTFDSTTGDFVFPTPDKDLLQRVMASWS